MSPFDFLNAINTTKQNVMVDDLTEKSYSGFMVNRGLSYFPDTILLANEMNIRHGVDSRLQFDFLINTVRSRKRFSKWMKHEDSESLQAIKEYFGYSNEKARQALSILTQDQLIELKKKVYKGGKR